MDDYISPKSNLELFNSASMASYDVIYPSCDSELLLDTELQKEILDSLKENTIISISTKAKVSKNLLSNIIIIDRRLKEINGHVKLSVSVSNKYRINELEPMASSYSERIESLKIISSNNIACSLNIKPIIPSIPLSEYIEIVDDFAPYTERYLLGGLYMEKNSNIKESLINSEHLNPYFREVNWLPNNPKWLYYEDIEKTYAIKKYIESIERLWFDSDIDLINSILKTISKNND